MTRLDPLRRWREVGEKPVYAGPLSFGDVPYTEDERDLEGVDVAIVGAPVDDLVSERPGARYGPRAIRAAGRSQGRHLEAGVDPFSELAIVDFGDAAVVPGDAARSHRAIEDTVRAVVEAGAIPIVLGGDHSITEPNVRAVAARTGPVGMIHFDAHADTHPEVFGSARSHGTPMHRLVEDGLVDSTRYVQIGLRGYSPPSEVLSWQAARGITTFPMHELRRRGVDAVVDDAIGVVRFGPVFLTIDIDVLDPAFAGGTGTPEPGGMATDALLQSVRSVAERLDVAGVDIVEVIPLSLGVTDVTAVTADRLVREALTGMALRRAGHLQPGTTSSTVRAAPSRPE